MCFTPLPPTTGHPRSNLLLDLLGRGPKQVTARLWEKLRRWRQVFLWLEGSAAVAMLWGFPLAHSEGNGARGLWDGWSHPRGRICPRGCFRVEKIHPEHLKFLHVGNLSRLIRLCYAARTTKEAQAGQWSRECLPTLPSLSGKASALELERRVRL